MNQYKLLAQIAAAATVAAHKVLNDTNQFTEPDAYYTRVNRVTNEVPSPEAEPNEVAYRVTVERWVARPTHGGGYEWVSAEEADRDANEEMKRPITPRACPRPETKRGKR